MPNNRRERWMKAYTAYQKASERVTVLRKAYEEAETLLAGAIKSCGPVPFHADPERDAIYQRTREWLMALVEAMDTRDLLWAALRAVEEKERNK
jgi:hypothetical protein